MLILLRETTVQMAVQLPLKLYAVMIHAPVCVHSLGTLSFLCGL